MWYFVRAEIRLLSIYITYILRHNVKTFVIVLFKNLVPISFHNNNMANGVRRDYYYYFTFSYVH